MEPAISLGNGKVFSDTNRVLVQLPFGKLKNGRIVDQGPQKGMTCLHYAIKSILTPEQLQSTHGKQCAQHKKAIASLGLHFISTAQFYEAQKQANVAFIQTKGLDLQKAADEIFRRVFSQGSGIAIHLVTEEIISFAKPIVIDQKPWYHLEVIHTVANHLIAKGHGLNVVSYEELSTLPQLIATLKSKGPLVIAGSYGKAFYGGKEARQMNWTFRGQTVHAWNKSDPKSESPVSHAIMLKGAELRNGNEFVYWDDPNDSNLKDKGRHLKVSSLTTILERMTTLDGVLANKIQSSNRSSIPVAYYNPSLKFLEDKFIVE